MGLPEQAGQNQEEEKHAIGQVSPLYILDGVRARIGLGGH